jgi:hypothetical protein
VSADKRALSYRPLLSVLGVLWFLSPSLLWSQTRVEQFQLTSSTDSVIRLAHGFIIPQTLRLTLDSSLALSPNSDYVFDSVQSIVTLSPSLRSLLWTSTVSTNHVIRVTYTSLPIRLERSYSLYKSEPADLDSLRDSTGRTRRLVASATEPDVFLGTLQRSGSISRGFQVGSNRDLALTSGFNLQFSGDLAQDITVTGALSEESTPIQPEGTTQTLQDIDRIYITLKAGEHFGATLGDFYFNLNAPQNIAQEFQSQAPLGITSGHADPFVAFSQSTFDVLSRKLLGAQAAVNYRQGGLIIAGASARGQHTTNSFQGEEAVQGPYRLTGKNGERAIIIVAGSERIYVDGQLQTRGEQNDYIIDYSLGEVRFEPRRLITSDSRITVDFEYSDQQYSRSLIAASGTGRIGDDRFNLTASYLREGDNPDVPLDLSLSDTDRTILAAAGNDRSRATRSGVTLAGRDLSGRARGSYVKVDSLIGGVTVILYRYAPFDTVAAIYNVVFGYAGANGGSYLRQGIGQYAYVGTGSGDYDTLRFLPLPELDQIFAVHGSGRITQSLGVTAEFATSAFDQNRLSGLNSRIGKAYRVGAMFADTLGFVGYTELRIMDRFVDEAFHPLDRTQDVEFLRRYGNDAQPGTISTAEQILEGSILYRPVQPLQFDVTMGSLDRPGLGFNSSRLSVKTELMEDTVILPHLVASIESLPTSDSVIGESAKWTRIFAEAAKSFGVGRSHVTVGGRFGSEAKHSTPTSLTTDSLTGSSFSYRSYGPFLKYAPAAWLHVSTEVNWRYDDSVRGGLLSPFSKAVTERATLAIVNAGGFSSNIDATLRYKTFADSTARYLSGGDQRTQLLRFEPHYLLPHGGLSVDGLYEVSDQRSARQERVFLPVQAGYGSYKYLGDLNHNGKPDDNEFEIARYPSEAVYVLVTVPTEQLFPVTDLRTNARLRISPRELLSARDSASTLSGVASAISSETFVQINETSRDPNANDIYFLKLSHFLNPASTVKGSYDFEQDFNILELNPLHSYRLHFLERKIAGQYNTGLERSYLAERSLRARLHPSFEFLGETVLQSSTDVAESDSLSLTRPHNTSLLSGSTDWTYHPIGSALDYSMRIEAGHALESSLSPNLTAWTDAVIIRSSYALESRARLRAEFERDELTIHGLIPTSYLLPYSLTGGRAMGTTWLWRLAMDYQFASGIVATVSYDGRDEPITDDRQTIHTARAEVRASF